MIAFVCLHGMGLSRVAAAYLGLLGPANWRSISVGLEPGPTLSPTAARLLAGTPAEPFLDRDPPRGLTPSLAADRVIALRNPSLRYALTDAECWDLCSSDFDVALREEIRSRVAFLAADLRQ